MNGRDWSIRCALVSAMFLIACDAHQPKGSPDPETVQFWSLSTGSRVAAKCFAANDTGKRGDVVFVHGGPGAYQVSESERGASWYRSLAQMGFSVYLYDQIGSGLSERLSDPRQYTLARHIADLEAIRMRIDPERFILIGDSWGATLVSNYMAVHANRVDRVIFTSPGPINPSQWWSDFRSAAPRMTPDFFAFVKERYDERTLRWCEDLEVLLQTDVQAAYAKYPDSVMDPLADGFIDSMVLPVTVHDKQLIREMRFHGMGWWALTMTRWSIINSQTDPRGTLSEDHTPVMILRGDADFLEEGIAQEYQETFPEATLIRIGKSGHFIWLDQPYLYAHLIEMFLLKD